MIALVIVMCVVAALGAALGVLWLIARWREHTQTYEPRHRLVAEVEPLPVLVEESRDEMAQAVPNLRHLAE